MNYFLLLLIIGLGAGGYYEYTMIQATNSSNQQQFTDLSTKIDALQASEKDLKQSVADLTKQVAGGPMQLNAGSAPVAQTPPATPTAPSAPVAPTAPKGPPPPSNLLGNISTPDSKTYQNCRLLKVEADGIVINHSEGIIKLSYDQLPPALQKRFGFDPQWGPRLTGDKVDFDEQQRQAAGD